MAKPHKPRNKILAGRVSRLSRSAVYKKKALYKKKKQEVTKKEVVKATKKVKPIGGDKNGGERVVSHKKPRFYPTEGTSVPLKHRKHPKIAKLRTSLTPGTIVILLAGRHKGKRVVFLKQLPTSGLLLVTGPYKVNGVPLRRVPQSYVIATRTKIDLSTLKLPKNVADPLFTREKKKKKRSDDMFAEAEKGFKMSEERKSAQVTVDEQILPKISEQEHLRKYMQQLFTLRRGQFPHAMVF